MMTKRIFSALLAAALSLSLLAGCGSTSGSTASSAADGPQRYFTVFYDVFAPVTQVTTSQASDGSRTIMRRAPSARS